MAKIKKEKKTPVVDANVVQIEDKAVDITAGVDFDRGTYAMKDYIAPPSIERDQVDYIKIGRQYVRNFVIHGYPNMVDVGWLDSLYNANADIDTTIHIEPEDDAKAQDSLTRKITQFEAQLATENEKGNIRNVTRLSDIIAELYEERRKLERNTERLYQIQVVSNLTCNSKEELDKEWQLLESKLSGQRIKIMPTYLRQDDGYKSTLPFGKSYLPDLYRNFNSGALTACFPFYNAELMHKNGIFLGANTTTLTPVLVDFYDKSILNNANISVLGQAGTGKSFFLSLLTLRSALRGIRTVIVDPEREYEKLTKEVGGAYICIATDSKSFINPFDIEEEDITDPDGYPTGIKTVSVNDKVSDLLNLLEIMARGLTDSQRAVSATLLQQLYYDRGINENPDSLYIDETVFDKDTGELYLGGKKKVMPTFSDFHLKLEEQALKTRSKELEDLSDILSMFKKGGLYDLFDCQTSSNLENFTNAPIVTFDVSQLEDGILRPIGMYVALSWTWEKFVKKNPHIKKRVICDEAWMLVSKSMAGSEYSARFLENAARRIRKRNGGLVVASQHFSEFSSSLQGQAVLKQAVTNIFLGQDATDLDALQDMFKLSGGEAKYLMLAQRGQMLIRMHGEVATVDVTAFDYEKKLIEKAKFEQ